MPRIPVYQPSVEPTTPRIDQPVIPSAPRQAFGEDVARSGASISKVIDPVADIFQRRAQELQDIENDVYLSNLSSQFQNDLVEKSAGLLNRTMNDSRGSVFELDDWYRDRRNQYLSNIKDPTLQSRLGSLMDTEFQNKREALFKHERQQVQNYREESQNSHIQLKKENFASIQTTDILKKKIGELEELSESLYRDTMNMDEDSVKLKVMDDVEGAAKIFLTSSLQRDPTGEEANQVIDSFDLTDDRKNTLRKLVDNQVKENSDDLINEMDDRYLRGELDIGFVQEAGSLPPKKGGIGGKKANEYIGALKSRQEEILKPVSKADSDVEKYVDTVSAYIADDVTEFGAKKLLIDLYSDGLSDEDRDLLLDIRKGLSEKRWDVTSSAFIDNIDTIKEWFFFENPERTDRLVNAMKKIMQYDRNIDKSPEQLQEFSEELIKHEQVKMNPNRAKYEIDKVYTVNGISFKVLGFFPDGEPDVEVLE